MNWKERGKNRFWPVWNIILQFSRGDWEKLPVRIFLRPKLDTWILRIPRRNINYPTVTSGKTQKKFSYSGIKLLSRSFWNYRNGVCKIKELRNNNSLYTWAAKCRIKDGVPNFQTENMCNLLRGQDCRALHGALINGHRTTVEWWLPGENRRHSESNLLQRYAQAFTVEWTRDFAVKNHSRTTSAAARSRPDKQAPVTFPPA
jgi:hypothetical protein